MDDALPSNVALMSPDGDFTSANEAPEPSPSTATSNDPTDNTISSEVTAESIADSSMVASEVPERRDSSSSSNDAVSIGADSSALAKALSSMLSSVIRDFDSKAEDTFRSQDKLSFALDRLARELDQLLEDAPLPFIMQHAVKISGVRKRVSSLNALLKSIQRRVDNIDRMLTVGSLQENTTMENLRQHKDGM